MPVLQLVQ